MASEVGDVLRAVARMSDGAADVINVFHLLLDGSVVPDDAGILGSIADKLDTAYDVIDAILPDNLTFDSIDVYNITKDLFLGSVPWPSLTAGGATGGQVPPQVAPLIRFTTNVLRSQGRKFLPAIATYQTKDDDGTLSATGLSILGGFASQLLSPITYSQGQALFGNYNAALERFAYWTGAIVNDAFATQRRRYRNRGS